MNINIKISLSDPQSTKNKSGTRYILNLGSTMKWSLAYRMRQNEKKIKGVPIHLEDKDGKTTDFQMSQSVLSGSDTCEVCSRKSPLVFVLRKYSGLFPPNRPKSSTTTKNSSKRFVTNIKEWLC